MLLAGKLHAVRVPGPEEEALRDLVRAREAVREDLMRCRHRLSKLLLRHGIRFDDGPAWWQRHRDWLATIVLEWPAAQATLLDAQGAIDALVHRREALEREAVALLPGSPWPPAGGGSPASRWRAAHPSPSLPAAVARAVSGIRVSAAADKGHDRHLTRPA